MTRPVAANELRASLIADAQDGSWDEFTLGQAALIAGRELTEAEFKIASARLADTVSKAVEATRESDSRAVALFRYLHQSVLTGEYRSGQNDLNRLLERGDYNCVTATILYQEFCRAANTDTQAIAAPAHVFCRLAGGDAIRLARSDVETTCPTWFDEPPRTAPRAGRPINEVQLVGKIFYNRGVYLLEMERFSSALEQLEFSLSLDPDDATAKSNQLAAWNNWALAESEAGRYASAVALLQNGSVLNPGYAPLLANDLHIHQKWVRELCRQQREAEAVRILLDRQRERPEEPLYRDGPLAIYRYWLQRLAKSPQWESEISEVTRVRLTLPDRDAALAEERQLLGPKRASLLAEFGIEHAN